MTEKPTSKPCPFCGSEDLFATEDARDHGYISCHDCYMRGPCVELIGPQGWTASYHAWNTRTAPKVKPLEWWEPCKRNNQTIGARTPIGTYYIHVDGGKHEAWLESNALDEDEWSGPFRGNLYEAQTDAQADYERRILEALE